MNGSKLLNRPLEQVFGWFFWAGKQHLSGSDVWGVASGEFDLILSVIPSIL